eukprot:scaffold4786_cov198-Amphora_coffeaeformis.AAC.4
MSYNNNKINNSNNCNDDAPRRTHHPHVCRFDLPSIPLQILIIQTAAVVSLQDLEAYLDDGMDAVDDDDRPRCDSVRPPIEYKVQADVIWTNARRPRQPLHTVLGFVEEEEEQAEHNNNNKAMKTRLCEITIYQQSTTPPLDNTIENIKCTCSFPQPPWQEGDVDEEEKSSLSHHHHHHHHHHHEDVVVDTCNNATTDATMDVPKRIDWIDLSTIGQSQQHGDDSAGEPFFPTPRCVLHVLRSILGTDQTASPWTKNRQKENTIHNATTAVSQPPDAVILAVPAAVDTTTLERFRVSDASPSWTLHAVIPAWQPRPNDKARKGDKEGLVLPLATTTTTCCSLFIYKRLPPRDCLTYRHPVTNQPVPVPECLWETIVPKNTNAENDDEPLPPYYRLVAPPYLNPVQHYPDIMQLLQDNLAVLQHEAQQIAHWTAWPEQQHYQATFDPDEDGGGGGGGAPWNVFPLCYCFPAHDVTQRTWVDATTVAVPRTTHLLQQVGPVLRTALFSRLDPGARLEAHTGWQDLANHVVRLHVPLDIPNTSAQQQQQQSSAGLCGTWVDGCVMTHHQPASSSSTQHPWICFDDSKIHRAFNYSTAHRTVLILDLARPPHWPLGTATGGHSDELDAFIQQMSAPR